MCTWQSQDACALSRHCEPCKQNSWSRARNSQENRPFLTASGVGTQSPPWTITVSLRKGLEFAPQQMPGTQSQLGGLVGGRGRKKQKTKKKQMEREVYQSGGSTQDLYRLSQINNHYTMRTQTHTHTRQAPRPTSNS